MQALSTALSLYISIIRKYDNGYILIQIDNVLDRNLSYFNQEKDMVESLRS